MSEITVHEFYEHIRDAVQLRLCAGEQGLERVISSNRIQKPGLALAGFTGFVNSGRVQILGETELSFLETLPDEIRGSALRGLVNCNVACIIVTKGQLVPAELIESCQETGTPLFVSPARSSEVIRKTIAYLDDLLSPRCSLHGVLVDVDGIGVLIIGASGIGKSECALDLVSRGHRLVADDVVEIRRRGEDLVGQASELIRNLIEVRGLGILNVAELFGVAATRDHKRIELMIELEFWNEGTTYDRTGLETTYKDILGVPVRSLLVPVQPGRNVAGIVEVAARNHLLMLRGHHAARELNERIQDAIRKSEVPERHLRTAAGLAEVTDHIEDEVE
ncbi:MAG: HPr(Ser) kinase/phosphatase [Myxococcales bacterium]|nr:HPr(Ser) kinase/phosphatase [Myxococcales bacterium]